MPFSRHACAAEPSTGSVRQNGAFLAAAVASCVLPRSWVRMGFSLADESVVRVLLSTTAPGLLFRLGTGGRGQKLLLTLLAAKVERLAIAFDVDRGGLVHGHSTDRVFSRGFRFVHSHVSFLVNGVIVFFHLSAE